MKRLKYQLFLFLFVSSIGLSQDKADSPSEQAVTKANKSQGNEAGYEKAVAAEFARQIDQVLSGLISKFDYSLIVDVELNPEKSIKPLPYMPSFAGAGLSPEFKESVKSVSSTIFISNQYVGKTAESLKEVLSTKLGLGDRLLVTFKPFEITRKGGDNPEVQKINEDLRAMQNERNQLERERNDLKRELTGANQNSVVKDYAIAGAIVIALGLLAFALIMVATKLQAAITAISAAIESAGSSLSSSLSSGDDVLGAALIEQPLLGNGEVANGGESISETQYSQLIRLREELTPSITSDNMSIVIQYITTLIATKNEAATAVLMLELLGEEVANKIYKSLSQENQMTVYKFLKNGEYGGHKAKLMLEAGELLKTKLIGVKMGRDSNNLDEKLVLDILNFSKKEINVLVSEMSLEHFSRLFHYLSSKQVTDVLQYLKYHDADKYQRALESLRNVPENESSPAGDKSIEEAINAVKKMNSENAHRVYLPLYKDIIENLSDDQAQDFMNVFSDGFDQVNKYFTENIITFNTVYELSHEYAAELFSKMTNRELAAIFFQVDEKYVETIKENISERRIDLILEEMERFEAMSKRVATQHFESAKTKAIAIIREMKGNLPMAEITGTSSNSNPEISAEASTFDMEGAA